MKKLLIPILLALIGLGGGIGAGLFLRPAHDDMAADPCGEVAGDAAVAEAGDKSTHDAKAEDSAHGGATEDGEAPAGPEYVKLNNQFIVPIVDGEAVGALVILSISLEVKAGTTQDVYTREPKLRDGFLEVLFAHANAGGFEGAFTESGNMDTLRQALLEVAQKTMGDRVSDVLITDIVRQDTRG